MTARIHRRMSGGFYSVSWNGKLFEARGTENYAAGTAVRVRYNGKKSQILSLLTQKSTSLTPSPSPGISSSANLALDFLTRALVRAGLPLPNSGELKRCRALLNHVQGSPLRSARLFAELTASGRDPSADDLELFERILKGFNRKKRIQKKTEKPGAFDWNRPPGSLSPSHPSMDLPRVLGREGRRWHLSLFEGIDEEKFHLALKLREGRPAALALTVNDNGRILEFLLETDILGKNRMTVASDTDIDDNKWTAFRRRMALMNFCVDDTISATAESDGFTPPGDE